MQELNALACISRCRENEECRTNKKTKEENKDMPEETKIDE